MKNLFDPIYTIHTMKGSIVLQCNILWSFNDSKQSSFVGAQPAAAALSSKFGEQILEKMNSTVCKKNLVPIHCQTEPKSLGNM